MNRSFGLGIKRSKGVCGLCNGNAGAFMPAFLPLTRADGNYKMPENPVVMKRKI
jgi:hypothetical protein